MALDTNTLKQSLSEAFGKQRNIKENPEDAAERLAGDIAQAILDFVKSGVVTVTTTVTGTCATPSGAGTIAGTGICSNGTIS